jgi:hypothetical protein
MKSQNPLRSEKYLYLAVLEIVGLVDGRRKDRDFGVVGVWGMDLEFVVFQGVDVQDVYSLKMMVVKGDYLTLLERRDQMEFEIMPL